MKNNRKSNISNTLQFISDAIETDQISLRNLLCLVGAQGMLLFCILLTIPFLLPLSIPGTSTPFGLLISFIGVGIVLNKGPWLPATLMERHFSSKQIKLVLIKGATLLARIDHLTKPRLFLLTNNRINRCNGLLLILVAILLMLPFGAIPFTNALPAWVILLICIGMLQRDGMFIIGGYLLAITTFVWFSFLGMGLFLTGQNVSDILW